MCVYKTMRGKTMKSINSILATLCVFISAYAHEEVTCNSTPTASCVNNDGMCLEFFAGDFGDEEMWQGACDSFEGVYASTGCDVSKSVLKCLNNNNVISPVMYFLQPHSAEDAKQISTMMQGKVCQ